MKIKLEEIYEYISDLYHRGLSYFIKKDIHDIFFCPSENCINDNYDVLNYRSDNVLCLFNKLLNETRYGFLRLHIVYHDKSKITLYKEFIANNSQNQVTFIYYQDRKHFIKSFKKCKLIFTDNYYHFYRFRTSNQKVICLSYYPSPFKDDFWKIEQLGGIYACAKKFIKVNKYYDYHLAASELSSILLSRDSLIHSSNFRVLGFPRDDIFYQDTQSIRQNFLDSIPFPTKKVFCYVPTHRDYESSLRQQYDSKSITKRSVFGNVSLSELNQLEAILEKTQSVIIVKIHPSQAKDLLVDYRFKRVLLLSSFSSKYNYGLSELLAISDYMITDYTSAVFDFLHRDKPILFYFYDYDKYNGTRGFVINPITVFCAGKITYSLSELIYAIGETANGEDNFSQKRRFLRDLLIARQNGDYTNRIVEYFLTK